MWAACRRDVQHASGEHIGSPDDLQHPFWVDEDGILRSGATAQPHSLPIWLGWTLKDGCGWWQLEEAVRTGRASQGKGRPRCTICGARVPCLRQPRIEQHAIQLGRSKRLLSTAHILLSSCVFAASARPPHTSVGMLLRVLGAGLSLLRPQGARLSVAGRPGVLSERTNIFYKGHMNESAGIRSIADSCNGFQPG